MRVGRSSSMVTARPPIRTNRSRAARITWESESVVSAGMAKRLFYLQICRKLFDRREIRGEGVIAYARHHGSIWRVAGHGGCAVERRCRREWRRRHGKIGDGGYSAGVV